MASVMDWAAELISSPATGLAAASLTGAVTIGWYWIGRHDDGKPVSRATKAVFFATAVVAIGSLTYLGYDKWKPRPETKPSTEAAAVKKNTDDSDREDANSIMNKPLRPTHHQQAILSVKSVVRSPIAAKDASSHTASPLTDNSNVKTEQIPEAKEFSPPMVSLDGQLYRVNLCSMAFINLLKLDGCGKEAADQYCRLRKMSSSVSYESKHDNDDAVTYFTAHRSLHSADEFKDDLGNSLAFSSFTKIICQ